MMYHSAESVCHGIGGDVAWCVEGVAWRGVLRGCGMVCVGFGEGWEDLSGCAMGLRELGRVSHGVAWCWEGMA